MLAGGAVTGGGGVVAWVAGGVTAVGDGVRAAAAVVVVAAGTRWRVACRAVVLGSAVVVGCRLVVVVGCVFTWRPAVEGLALPHAASNAARKTIEATIPTRTRRW
jgi:hypothetical protein